MKMKIAGKNLSVGLQSVAGKVGNTFHNRQFQRCALIVILNLLLMSTSVFAQGGGGSVGDGGIGETVKNAVFSMYFKWRLPICALGLLVAIATYASSDPRGKSYSVRIVVVILLITLAPEILRLLTSFWAKEGDFTF